MSEKQPRVDDIFDAALRQASPEDRAQYLNEACAGNSDLRRRVERLLRAVSDAGSFLETPAQDPQATIDQPPIEQTGTQVGPYKLLQEVGQGGMGVVYMAEQQEPVRRKVAVKIIKPGMDTRQVIARFEAERQALSLMDHPNIARVLDAGATGSGRPYFVMELVKGQPITDYCNEHHLTPRQRLELLVPVCQAIQHAHQKGIIHRDIKPSNVLVAEYDQQPVPKVIDFGVAKATSQPLTEKSMFTGHGQIVGTLEYMSPEQAKVNQLDIDTRSDIYSLGVLMYELLTGTTPFDKQRLRSAAWDEMLRIIREEDPPKPSTRLSDSKDSLPSISAQRQTEPAKLTRLVRGELDWMVMKALEKDRNRRYETANAFAADVLRYLADEPVQACPPSAWYRLRKFSRRNRSVLVTAALVATALVVGTVVSIQQALRAQAANRQTQAELEQKNLQYARAEANFNRALEAVDSLLLEVSEKDLATEPHLLELRRKLFAKALKFFDEFLRENGDDPATRFEAGLAYRRVGDIRDTLGEFELADQDYRRGTALLEALVAAFPVPPSYRLELAWILHERAMLQSSLGHDREAEQLNDRARKLQQTLLEQDAKNTKVRRGLANSQRLRALLLQRKQRYPEAIAASRQAVALLSDLLREQPEKSILMSDLAVAQQNLAGVLEEAGLPEETEAAYRNGIAIAQDLATNATADSDVDAGTTMLTRLNVMRSQFLWRRGKIPLAEETATLALESARRLTDKYPNVPGHWNSLAGACGHLGNLYLQTGRPGDAVKLFEECREIREKLVTNYPLVPDYHNQLGAALSNLATAWITQDDPRQARLLLEEAIDHLQTAIKIARHRQYREHLFAYRLNLAIVLGKLHVPNSELEQANQQCIELGRELASEFPDVATYQGQLGAALSNWAADLMDLGEFSKARPLAEEAIVHQRAALENNERNPVSLDHLRKHYDVLARILGALDSPEQEQAYRDVIPVAERLAELFPNAATHPSYLGKVKNDLGIMLQGRGELEPARRYFEEAIVHQQAALALEPSSPPYRNYLANHYGNLGTTLREMNQPAAALAAFQKCREIRAQLAADIPGERYSHVELGRILLWIANTSGETSVLKDAADAFRRAGTWTNAAEAFSTAISLTKESAGYDLFMFAIFAWHLDFQDEARHSFQSAVAWQEQHAATLSESSTQSLRQLRSEAEKLLGMEL